MVMYVVAGYTLLYPSFFEETGGARGAVGWWVVFFVGAVLGGVFNVQQERFFRKHGHTTTYQYMGYVFWQTLYRMIVGHALLWVDLLPSVGSANSTAAFAAHYAYTWRVSHEWPTLGFNALYNAGYFVTYVAACFVNTRDAFIGVFDAAAVSSVVVGLTYLIPPLRPATDAGLGLVPVTVVLSALSIVFYNRWVQKENPYTIVVAS